jgi:hypothetical protein
MGAIAGMVNSVKANLALKSDRKTMRDRNGDYRARVRKPLKYQDKMTAEQHEQHRAQLRAEREKSNTILYSLIIFSAVVVVVVICLI